jgi:hydroxymethylglutaryl-CoA lyase
MSWIVVEVDGKTRRIAAARGRDGVWISIGGRSAFHPDPKRHTQGPTAAAHDEIRAPMTGKVVAVQVAAGDDVQVGTVLAILEAMKMEYRRSRRPGEAARHARRRTSTGRAAMIRIVEVGPRDGLQNEKTSVPTAIKVAFIDALSAAGLAEIEASAFVSPKWIPQLADAEAVFAGITRRPGIVYSALVPNEKGLERALAARADKVAVFTAASETFNRKNINASIAESIERFKPVVAGARAAGVPVRGYVSTAFVCPYEGRIAPVQVVPVVAELAALGIDDLSIGDTIGKAQPGDVDDLLDALLPEVPAAHLALHFHDTYGHAAENVLAGYARGIRTFDSSAGGIGGCPYAPGAAGNVATEAVVRALRGAGADVPVDLAALARAFAVIGPALGRTGAPVA